MKMHFTFYLLNNQCLKLNKVNLSSGFLFHKHFNVTTMFPLNAYLHIHYDVKLDLL